MGDLRSRHTKSSFRPGRGSGRLTEWAAVTSGAAFTVPGVSVILFASFSQATLAALGNLTLVRIRGLIHWGTDLGASIGIEKPFGAFGIAVVKEAARAVGVSALPLPFTDASDDMWLAHQFLGATGGLVGGGEGGGGWVDQYIDMDSKAMRKIEDGDAIVMIFENGSIAAVGARVNFNGRFLFLTH